MSDKKRKVTIIFHEEEGSWWAESPDADSLYVTGESLDEVRGRVYQHLPDVLGAPVDVFSEVEIRAAGAPRADTAETLGLGSLAPWAPEKLLTLAGAA